MKKIFEGNNKFIVIGVVLLIGIIAYILPNKNNLAADLTGDANLDGAIEISQDSQKNKNKERPTLDISEDDFNVNVIAQKEQTKNNNNAQANLKKKSGSALNENQFKPEIVNNQTIMKEKNITNTLTNVAVNEAEKIGKIGEDEIFSFQNPAQIESMPSDTKDKNNQSANSNEIIALKAENAQLKNEVSQLKNEIAELKNEIAMLKNQKMASISSGVNSNSSEIKVLEKPKLSAEELKKQEELRKQEIANLEKLSKELNFYKPELKIINGKLEFESVLYKTGDIFLSRYKIEKITSNSVRFSRNGQFYNLRF